MTLAVLDTNVFVSAFLQPTGLPGRLLEWAEAGRFEVLCVMATDKIQRLLLRQRRWEAVQVALMRCLGWVTLVPAERPRENWIPEDPADNWVVQCALTAAADCIVSGDRHLSARNAIAGVRVFSPAAFFRSLESA